jgi:hypothetical protein
MVHPTGFEPVASAFGAGTERVRQTTKFYSKLLFYSNLTCMQFSLA